MYKNVATGFTYRFLERDERKGVIYLMSPGGQIVVTSATNFGQNFTPA